MEALATDEGGAIERKRVRKRSPKQREKIMEALATEEGGAIERKRVRKRSPKQKKKIIEALATREGGSIKYHDRIHKYLHQNLTGRGAGFDSPQCRKLMYNLMKHSHPSVWNSYVKGKSHDIHKDPQFHLTNAKPPIRQDPRTHMTSYGGSMRSLTLSENGRLHAHDHRFHHEFEMV